MNTYSKILFCAGLAALMSVSCNKEYPYQKVTPIDTPASVSLIVRDLDGEVALMAPKKKTFTLQIQARAIADELLTAIIKADPSLVESYNQAHGTSYEAVPAEAYEITTDRLFLPRYNTVSSTSELTLKSAGMQEDGKAYLLPLTIAEIKSESAHEFDMSDDDRTVYVIFRRKVLPESGFEYGTGTADDPYLIYTQTDFLCMSKAQKAGKPTYFRLEEDIDMSDYEDWVPVNSVNSTEIHFDGNGKTIKGFNCSADTYPSLFGIFTGSVRNLTFENPVLTTGTTSAGLLAACIGNSEAPEKATEISDIMVKGLQVNSSGTNGKGNMLGGIAGTAYNATFNNIDVELVVADADNNNAAVSQVGGIVGTASLAPSVFTNCHTSGSLVGHHSTAGILGYAQVEGCTLTDCSADVAVNSFGNNTGGLLGYANPATVITDCHATGNITGKGNFNGGLVGQATGATIIHSYATGNISSGGNYAGGLIGGGENGNLTVQKCYATGDVTSVDGKNHVGGLIGNMDTKGATGHSLVEDCYASGDLTSQGKARMYGGLVGVVEKSTGDVIRRCYASGNVILTGTYVTCGGLIAMAKTGSSGNDAQTLSIDFTMEYCIAWNKTVQNGNNPTSWSSGAIIGASSALNTLRSNYRRADMEFIDYGGVTLTDQSDVSPSAPLEGTIPSSYKFAYHGKAADKDATLTSVAKMLGWPESVWDFSGDIPLLK